MTKNWLSIYFSRLTSDIQLQSVFYEIQNEKISHGQAEKLKYMQGIIIINMYTNMIIPSGHLVPK